MNAVEAKKLNLIKGLTQFKPGQWVTGYWGSGDRDHQFTHIINKSHASYSPTVGTYYRIATPDEIKASQIIDAKRMLEDIFEKFKREEKIDQPAIKQTIKLLNKIL